MEQQILDKGNKAARSRMFGIVEHLLQSGQRLVRLDSIVDAIGHRMWCGCK